MRIAGFFLAILRAQLLPSHAHKGRVRRREAFFRPAFMHTQTFIVICMLLSSLAMPQRAYLAQHTSTPQLSVSMNVLEP